MFHYATGKIVIVGDHVLFDGSEGTIEAIYTPLTEDARDYSCYETGGVMINTEQFGLILMTPPDRDQWEDLELQSRAAH
ncbi:hypothetical protein [Poriferisphaera sp. WC338]|uniref:hypothetical protein n=1 Tax=Poriferisphaera sp. WC338 TaxID=3425129 RepID=UPI003D817ECF